MFKLTFVNGRVRGLLVAAILAAGCGSSPSTAPAPVPSGKLTLAAGNYMMNVGLTGAGGLCFVSSSLNGVTVSDSIQFPAVVTSANGTFVVRPAGTNDAGLVATVTTTPIGFTGSVSGQVRDTDKNVLATFSGNASLVGLDSMSTPALIGGAVTGSIDFANADSARQCTSGAFTLTPR